MTLAEGWVAITSANFSGLVTSGASLDDMSIPVNGQLQFDGVDDISSLVLATISAYCSDATVGFEWSLGLNGSSITDSRMNSTMTAVAGYRIAVTHSLLDLVTNDVIDVMVRVGASATLFVEDLSLTVFDARGLADTEVFTGTSAPITKP